MPVLRARFAQLGCSAGLLGWATRLGCPAEVATSAAVLWMAVQNKANPFV